MKPPASIGPYQVERPLGRGGMGVVYECRHPRLPRAVAVKQVLTRGADARALARFEREAALMARVRHPAIVTVHELGHTSDGPFIVMDLVEGRGLDRVARDAPVEPATAVRIARDLAGALSAMHAAGVIHRDVKPQNVMLRPDGAPVLLDFGLARELAAERLTRTGEVLGTVAYMAPEQADGKGADVDGRADVYSLGALLYELLAGRPPYEGGGVQVLAKLLGDEEPPPLSNGAGPPAPAALEAIVRVAMAKRPEDRYATAQALAADLGRYLEGEPPQALARVRRPRRVGAGVALAGGAGLVAAVVVGVLTWSVDPAPTKADARAPEVVTVAAAQEHLWVVRAGDELVYRLELHEDSGGQTVRFACTLALQPREDPGAAELRFACAVTHLSCSWGFGGVAVGERYDSASSDDRHPLAFLGAAVGLPFECRIEPRSGEVVLMSGFTDIHEAVAASPRTALRELLRGILGTQDLEPFFMRLIDVVFSDAFMRASMDALTRVADSPDHGPDRVVPWRSAGGLGSYEVTPGSRGPCALRSMTMDLTPGATFDYRGTSRYAAGRLEEAELRQDLVVDRGRGCSMRWSMRLVR